MNPDFVITGGDLVMDALWQSFDRADSLYNMYNRIINGLTMPVYNTIGNHDIFGWNSLTSVDPDHPEYGKKMFENRIGPRYQVIEHNGWKIFILDSVEKNRGSYKGSVDSLQMIWIQEELRSTPKDMPLVISVHIPFISAEAQILFGSLQANEEYEVITNSREVLELFNDHNLRLVLHGHPHNFEYIHVFGKTFVTGGAVCGSWWKGDYYGTEEGFLLVHVEGDEFSWEYVDYGWEVDQ
jgi:3',5'-cyclic AMP phosphodiesterase CpdA